MPVLRLDERAGDEQSGTRSVGLRGDDGSGLWPTIICQTRNVCERGLALVAPALREDDENFFGVGGG